MKSYLALATALALGVSASSGYAAGPGDVEAGKTKSAACAACHGADGKSPTTPLYPILAGQYRDYLAQALKDYKNGGRNNPIMQGMVAALSDDDILDLAAYYASLPSGLNTPSPD